MLSIVRKLGTSCFLPSSNKVPLPKLQSKQHVIKLLGSFVPPLCLATMWSTVNLMPSEGERPQYLQRNPSLARIAKRIFCSEEAFPSSKRFRHALIRHPSLQYLALGRLASKISPQKTQATSCRLGAPYNPLAAYSAIRQVSEQYFLLCGLAMKP